MNDLPECFCDDPTCDWEVSIVATYGRPDAENTKTSQIAWQLGGIPQPLAQAILQASVAAVNEKGWEVYKAWLEGCIGEDNPVSALMKKMPV